MLTIDKLCDPSILAQLNANSEKKVRNVSYRFQDNFLS